MSSGSPIITGFVAEYRRYKSLADGAIAQLTDDQLCWKLSLEQNSIYVIAQHISGNLRSRFTDFLTSDGEKPDRNRDGEFAEPASPAPRADFLAMWERGWKVVFNTLETLDDSDMARTVTIRTERYSVAEALTRSVAHTAYHVGQMLLLAKHAKGGGWTYLTVPPGETVEYNRQVAAGEQSQRVGAPHRNA